MRPTKLSSTRRSRRWPAISVSAAKPRCEDRRCMTAPVRSGDPIIVNVPLGEREYDIAIGRGLIASLGERIAKLRPGAAVAIVSDETVAARYLPQAEASLGAAGIRSSRVVVPPGESSKSWRVLESVCEQLLAARIERGDLV